MSDAKIMQINDEIMAEELPLDDIEENYRLMAQDEKHEKEALAWVEALIGDLELDSAQN